MALQSDRTTLVCLFHHQDRAQAAKQDLAKAGFPESSITVVGGPGAKSDDLEKSELASMEMPDKDYDHLKEGIRQGGTVLAVAVEDTRSNEVEGIFEKHSADKIDETERNAAPLAAAPLAAAALPSAAETEAMAIPIVEEELVVGKRQVDRGGARVYRHVVEVPVTQSIDLHEEHVVVDRHPINRAVTASDNAFRDREVTLNESAEEAVVSKTARVVEEVVIGKVASDRTETVNDSVRHTEVEIDEVPGSIENTSARPKK